MGKRKASSLTPAKAEVKHGIKKPSIGKQKDKNIKTKPKKNIVKVLGIQLLSSAKINASALAVGNEVEVKWVDNNTYPAKVMEIGDGECLVHYRGWKGKYDEWITTTNTALKKRKVFAEISNINSKESIKKKESVPQVLVYSDKDADEDDPEMAGLCEYEKIRLRNIREREALFEELRISEAKSDFSQMFTPTQNRQGPSKRGLASVKKEKEILPARKSSRLSGGKVPDIDRFVPLLEAPPEERSVPLEPVSIMETFSNSSDQAALANTQEFLSSLSNAATSESIISFNSSPLKSSCSPLKSSCSSLSVTEELVAKVVPDRVFSLAIHPSPTLLLAAAGDKSGHVGLWDVLATSSPSHGVHLYQPHTRPVNTISWDLANTNNIVSTSYDGTTRMLDTEKQEHVMIYGEKEFLDCGGWTTCHAQASPHTFLVSQGTAGTVVQVDRREGWARPANTFKLFDRIAPKSVSVHPLQTNLFITCNNKGGCFIFDTRNATNSSTKLMTAVSEFLGHSRSLSSCQFSSVTGNQVVTMSTDDKLRLFNTSFITETISPQCQVKHNNQTGRWLTPFRASWHPTREGMMVTGSMERPRQIEVWGTGTGSLDMVSRLKGEMLGSVCSLVEIHPSSEVVVGGNSSGRVHVFM